MSLQQAVNPRSQANGYNHRRVETETSSKMENKLQLGKLNSSRNSGISSSCSSGAEGPLSDRLVYITTCLIGHPVDVQVKNGSVFSGIFHATSADKEFGIVLKMAWLVKDTSFRGQKAASESFGKSSSETLIIPAQDLVQIIAKDVSVMRDGLAKEHQAEKQQDLMIDTHISKSRHLDVERELKPWVPDEDVPQCPELENTFNSPWTGSWDQFKVNEALFGVRSTFDEELYTTKLDKGPQTRELEAEAMRIAREIEGEGAHDLYIAGEGGVYPPGKADVDEETLFSSVIREFDDSGLVDEDLIFDTHNDETFGNSSGPISGRSFANVTSRKAHGGGQILRSSSSMVMDKSQSSQSNHNRNLFLSGSLDSEHCSRSERPLEEERVQENQVAGGGKIDPYVEDFVEEQTLMEELHLTKTEGLQAAVNTQKDGSDKGGLSPNATEYAPSDVSIKGQEKANSHGEASEGMLSGEGRGVVPAKHSHGRPGSTAPSTSESGAAATSAFTGPGLSPSSSVGSLSSEKSTLNPNAKEFRLNPNAKSYVPSQAPVRPLSPVGDGSYYFPANVPAVPHLHGMHVGMGVSPSFSGPQPMIFNPPIAPMQSPPQGYFPGNGPQFGQQMMVGHPRQVLYMQGYHPPEMQFRGREF